MLKLVHKKQEKDVELQDLKSDLHKMEDLIVNHYSKSKVEQSRQEQSIIEKQTVFRSIIGIVFNVRKS